MSRFAIIGKGRCQSLFQSSQNRPALGPVSNTTRTFSSVVNLSDDKAVEKFRMINQKSVLYFTANWCGPCKMIKPLYDDLSKKHTGIAFGKVDIDENEAAAVDFEIAAVPTFILFDGEDAVERFTGADSTKLEKSVAALEQKQ